MHAVKPIETRYAGCRFRSRLEARWAVFFDTIGIPWEYEPQGFTLSNGRNYLPDFLLPECGTWIEVKGAAAALDRSLIELATRDLPKPSGRGECGPKIMVLGPIPAPQNVDFDLGWKSFDFYDGRTQESCSGFGLYPKNLRPWWLPCGDNWASAGMGHDDILSPCHAPEAGGDLSHAGYAAARSARFEHGESGASR